MNNGDVVKTLLIILSLLGPALLSATFTAVQSTPSDDVLKVYISPAADLTVVEHPEDEESNYGYMEYLDVGYLWTEGQYCGGGPCISILQKWDVITLLKYELPDPGGWEVKRVFLIIPATYLYYDLPGDDYSELCRFAIAKFDHIFFEDQTTWGHWMKDEGAAWDPWDYVIPVAGFYVTPSTGSPIVIDLTDELRDRIQEAGDFYMALAPLLEWEGYEWGPGMTCQLLFSSSESNQGGPVLYVEYGPKEYEVEGYGLPDIPFIPQDPPIPPNLGDIISAMEGEGGEPVPLPDIPWDQISEIPKIVIPQIPILPTPVPTLPPPPTMPPPPEYPPTFSLQMTPALQSVQAGGTVTFTVHVIPHFGFSDWVQLSASGGPAGSSITLTPPSVNPAAATKPEATLTVQIPGWAPPGNYLITVVGQSGQLLDSASAWIMVQPQPGQPEQPPAGAEGDFYLIVSPKEQSTTQGVAATFEVYVQPVGDFQEDVDLFLVNPPQGSKFIVHGSPVHPGSAAHVRVLPTEGTPPGTYELMLIAAGGGIHRSTSAFLNVESKSAAGTPTSPETSPPPGGAAAAIELLVGEPSLTAPPGQKVRTWLAVTVTHGHADVASFEVVEADPGVHYELSAQQASPGDRVILYLWAESPGSYTIRVRATAGGAQDEKVIGLSVSGAGAGGTPEPGCTEAGCRVTRPPESSPGPREGGGMVGLLEIRLWPDLIVFLLAALVVLLVLLLIVVSRRRVEGGASQPQTHSEVEGPSRVEA